MKLVYPVIFTQTNDSKDTYLVDIPDLNGSTEGYGLADAIFMARDYIGCTLYDKDESQFPKASELSDIDVSKGTFAECGPSSVSMVDIDIVEYRKQMDQRAVRKNVSIPAWMDSAAKREHLNISRVLQEALEERLGASV